MNKKVLAAVAMMRLGITGPQLTEQEHRAAMLMVSDSYFQPLIETAQHEISKASPSTMRRMDPETSRAFDALPAMLKDAVPDAAVIGRRAWRENRIKELSNVKLPSVASLGLNTTEQAAVLRLLEDGSMTPEMVKGLQVKLGNNLYVELTKRIMDVRGAQNTVRELAAEAGSDLTAAERATMQDNVFVASVSEKSRQSAERLMVTA